MDNKWLEKWTSTEHDKFKQESFSVLDNFLTSPPKKILDIGCGLAKESELFQKKYGTELYLLDGDFDNTKEKTRDIRFGSADNFKFYSKISDLQSSFDTRNMKYTFIDANSIILDAQIKFDLVYSILSCGFHYPADTYKDLIKKHTTTDSIILLDIRHETLDKQKSIEVIKEVKRYKKHSTLQVKFI